MVYAKLLSMRHGFARIRGGRGGVGDRGRNLSPISILDLERGTNVQLQI